MTPYKMQEIADSIGAQSSSPQIGQRHEGQRLRPMCGGVTKSDSAYQGALSPRLLYNPRRPRIAACSTTAAVPRVPFKENKAEGTDH